jgi:hypothetical protein
MAELLCEKQLGKAKRSGDWSDLDRDRFLRVAPMLRNFLSKAR